MPKCKWCKEDGEKEQMVCYEKPTNRFKKDGSVMMSRSYYHNACDELRIEDEVFKKKEAEELDGLYQYLLKLHNLELLDGRMFEKIQDLRNGTIKINNRKIRKSKEGVSYKQMLDTYQHVSKNIDYAIRTKQFKTKWNEFSYVFSIMVNSLNEVNLLQKRNNAITIPTEVVSNDFDIKMNINKQTKKDDMDISHLL
ncbi:hypothetical protein ABE073_04830 [Lederbergia citrisecunda]|uniref:hypothetical protein n=1 Tax=Lederbergia citrisecunda TaxID=2833583 RepID=UPI003D29E618